MNYYSLMKLPETQFFTYIKGFLTKNIFRLLLPLGILLSSIFIAFKPNTKFVEAERNIIFLLDQQELESVMIADASVDRSEQTKGIFAKTLNINAIDENDGSLAITVFDLENADIGKCMTLGKYFGEEHEQVLENFNYDIGMASFSNKCNLIYEKENGNLVSSRNGWVEIEQCMDGFISGSFEFQTLEGEIFSKGKFNHVAFQFSE